MTADQATEMKGWITKSYTTYKGKKLGPYYVRTWFEHGKKRKQYVKKKDLARVRAECQAHHEMKIRGRQIASQLAITLGNLNWLDRMAKRLDKGTIRSEDHAFVEQIKRHGITTPGRTSLKSQPTTNNSHPHIFMDHFFQNPEEQFWTESFADAERIARAFFDSKTQTETHEQKWKRWRESMKKNPKPRPLPLMTPPTWVDKNEVTAAVLEIIKERKESSPGGTTGDPGMGAHAGLQSSPGGTTGGSTQRGMGAQGSSNSEVPETSGLPAVAPAKKEPLVREEERSAALLSQPTALSTELPAPLSSQHTTVSPQASSPEPRAPRSRPFTEQLRHFKEAHE